MSGGEHIDREKLRIGQERDDYARALDRALTREFNPEGITPLGFTTFYDNTGPESMTFDSYQTMRNDRYPLTQSHCRFIRGFRAGYHSGKVDSQ